METIKRLDKVLSQLEEKKIDSKVEHTEFGKVLVLGRGLGSLPAELLSVITSYADSIDVLNNDALDGDCAQVAGAAVRGLSKDLEKNGYGISTLGAGNKTGVLPFYRKFGYGYHLINCIESEEMCIGLDLTASYTLATEQRYLSLFVLAETEKELISLLRDIIPSLIKPTRLLQYPLIPQQLFHPFSIISKFSYFSFNQYLLVFNCFKHLVSRRFPYLTKEPFSWVKFR